MKSLRKLQHETELVYDKNQARVLIEETVSQELADEHFDGDLRVAKAIVVMLTESLKDDVLIQNAISRMLHLLDMRPSQETLGQVLRLLEKYNKTLYEIDLYPNHAVIVPKVQLSYAKSQQVKRQMFLPPMLCKPNNWTTNTDGGYLVRQLPAISKWRNMHDGELALDVLNKLQAIPFELDHFVLENCKDTVPDVLLKQDQETTVSALLFDKQFYFAWQFDGRGRMYSHGHHMNLQSREYKKALINLSNKERLNADGMEGLLIHIANACGKDKQLFKQREEYADNRIAPILKAYMAGDPVDLDYADIEHEEPITYVKAVKAVLDHLDGLPVGIMVSFDSTSSGIQLMAAMSGCHSSAKMTNLIHTGRRVDAYTETNVIMNLSLESGVMVPREDFKEALMTHYYCSTKTPRNLFDDEQLEAFYNTTSSIFKGCEYVMQEVINSWTDADEYSWCMPDGHWVVVRPRIVEEVEINWHGCEFTYDFPKQAATGNHRHLPANVVHSVDAYVAREMVRRCDFEVVTNHDCYSSHPNYWKHVCETYREIVA